LPDVRILKHLNNKDGRSNHQSSMRQSSFNDALGALLISRQTYATYKVKYDGQGGYSPKGVVSRKREGVSSKRERFKLAPSDVHF